MLKKHATRKTSLATGVIVTALAAAMFIVGLLIAFDAYRLSNLVSASLERRAEQVASLQGSALLQPLADYETDVVEAMLSNLVTDPEMQAAQVLDAEGNIVVESGAWSDEASNVLSVEQRLETSEDDGSEHLGSFRLQVSRAELIQTRNTGIYIGIASLLVVALAIWLVLQLSFRRITGPLESMIEVMGALTRGDTDIAVPAQERNDEIGRIATAVEVFKKNAIERVRLEEEADQAKTRAEEEKNTLLSKMADDFEASIGIVVERVSKESNKMKSSATGMSATAEAASQQSNTVVTASSQASANVQTVARATDELTDSITEISRQSAQSTTVADRAVQEVENTNVRVQSLADSAHKIGQVIGLINDVAEQTNLLALNATIEAARAGDAGKGFAVVASEVKNLATQTSEATEEISGQIAGIQAATEDAVKAMAGIGEIISEINNIASSIAAAVEEQSVATQEIARNVDQASTGTQEVSTNIAGVNDAVVQTGTEAGRILQGAGDMAAQSDILKQEVSNFLAKIRTG